MLTCPSCHTNLDFDFGMGSCGSCGAMLVVDINGTVQLAEQLAGDATQSKEDAEVFVNPEISNVTNTSIAPLSENFSDVIEFANSEISQAKDGTLVYHISLEGIDTQEIRQQLFEVISDKKFLWDASEVMKNIQSGKLSIKNLSAVKANVLLTHIKFLPITAHWQQQHIASGVQNV